MDDYSVSQLYAGILISLAILVVPGIVVEAYWWWQERERRARPASWTREDTHPPREREEKRAA